MCSVCRQYPCHPMCPNAPEPTPIYECTKCGYGIFEGEKYFDSPDGYICEECMEEMSSKEILELLGEKFSVAS